MACSCKKVQRQGKKVSMLTTGSKVKQQPVAAVPRIYDFSSTTTPSQSCINCAQKHISLALALYESSKSFDHAVAASEIYLASSHLRKDFPNTAVYCRQLARIILEDLHRNWYSEIKYLLLNIQQIQQQSFNIEDTDFSVKSESDALLYALLNVCRVYSLLFTEVTYQSVNRPVAVGLLVRAVLPGIFSRKLLNIRTETRQAWKILQETQPGTDQWQQLKLRIVSIIQSLLQLHMQEHQSDSQYGSDSFSVST